MLNFSPKYIDRVKITPSNLITYQYYVGDMPRIASSRSLENLNYSKNKEDMSKKASRRLMLAMDWMLLIAREKYAMNMKKNKLFKYKLSLITLTLPCAQFHSDNFIKKHLLNQFLTRLRKEYQLCNYIWKAEKQYNGNIHFHVVIDKYIYFKELNHIWNHILKTHGYIAQYRINQINHHKDGFTPRPELYPFWSYNSQLKAYKEGWRSNWENPVGTSDIHSLKKIKNARAYLAKYLTKNPDKSKAFSYACKEYRELNHVKTIPDTVLNNIRSVIKDKLKLEGNLWYICRNLSKVKGTTADIEGPIKKELELMLSNFKDKILQLDNCCVFKFNIYELLKYKFTALFNCLKEYCMKLREFFYPPGELERYSLGIPLPIFEKN